MEPDDRTYLVSGALLDDEPVGPVYVSCAEAQTLARTVIARVGGTARILRNGDDGWVEVARYTDTGVFSRGTFGGHGSWAVIGAVEVVELRRPRRRRFARLRRLRRWRLRDQPPSRVAGRGGGPLPPG